MRTVPVLVAALLLVGESTAQMTSSDIPAPRRWVDGCTTRPSIVARRKALGDLPTVVVALPGDVDPLLRPRLLVVGGLGKSATAGAAIAAKLPTALADLAETDLTVAAALSKFAVEVVLLPARDASKAGVAYDDDHDGLVNEDPPKDLDGDGRITTMRVPDPLGDWRVSPESPRLMVKVDRSKGERGTHRIVVEGLDADGDGAIAEDGPNAVEIDRNFPHGWREFDAEAGMFPLSDPGARELADLVMNTKPIVGVLALGDRDTLVSGMPKWSDERPHRGADGDDADVFADASTRFKKRFPDMRGEGGSPDGAFHAWAYHQRGIFAFASPSYSAPKVPEGAKVDGAEPNRDDLRRLYDSDTRLGGRGFAPWKPFEHPTLGSVDVGGFVDEVFGVPTEAEVPALVDGHAGFIAELLERLPKLVVPSTTARSLGAGLYELRATLANEGRWPTLSRMAGRTRVPLPTRVELTVPEGTTFELGEARTLVETFGGSGAGRELRWMMRIPSGVDPKDRVVRLDVVSEKAGGASVKVALKEEAK